VFYTEFFGEFFGGKGGVIVSLGMMWVTIICWSKWGQGIMWVRNV